MSRFAGFEEPEENWSKLPHQLIEALPLIETEGELKVILYILRHTWGFRDDQKRITLDEFAHGRKRRDKTRIDNGTGLSIPTIRNGLQRAIEHGFIVHEQDARDKARVKNFYSLNMKASEKDLHPDCKEDSVGMHESLPRTEKETLERNLEERNNHGASADDDIPSVLLNSTPARRILKAKLDANVFAPNGRRGPKKFGTLPMAQKFDAAAARLDGNLGTAIDAALEQGCSSVVRVVNYIAKYQPNGGPNGPTHRDHPTRSQVPDRSKEVFFDPATGQTVHYDAAGNLVPVL